MIRVCYLCKRTYGQKEPFEDRRASHGLCEACVPLEQARIEKELLAMINGRHGHGAIHESPLHGQKRRQGA
jgi:hypothetical protein